MSLTKPKQTVGRGSVAVWDRGVRLVHWGLVAAVALCAYTGFLAPRNWLNLHIAAGVAILALVLFRLVWGFTGTTYARFASFPPSPSAALAHARAIAQGFRRHWRGHNPLGALMVYGLLAVLAALIATGAVALGGMDKQGPLAFLVPFAMGTLARQVHELLALLLLGLIAAHLGGVAFESLWARDNLVRAMLTGRKPAAPAHAAVPVHGRPVRAVAAMAVAAAVLVPGTILLSRLPGRGVPPAALDPAYAHECGACHLAFPPSLAGAATWSAVMDGLANHFGEDASLDPAATAHVREWLLANSAEHWDTRPANLFRVADPAEPRRITSAQGWRRFHRDLPDAVFAAKAVGAKGACNACHQDAATGRFDPQRIAIPQEAPQ